MKARLALFFLLVSISILANSHGMVTRPISPASQPEYTQCACHFLPGMGTSTKSTSKGGRMYCYIRETTVGNVSWVSSPMSEDVYFSGNEQVGSVVSVLCLHLELHDIGSSLRWLSNPLNWR